MKRFFLPFFALAYCISISSCSKCGHCSGAYHIDESITVCQKDSKTVYEQAVQDCYDDSGQWVAK